MSRSAIIDAQLADHGFAPQDAIVILSRRLFDGGLRFEHPAGFAVRHDLSWAIVDVAGLP